MPFDAAGFSEEEHPPPRPAGDDTAAIAIILTVTFTFLIVPVLPEAITDIVRWFQG